MNSKEMVCPKCQSNMIEGTVFDLTKYGMALSSWQSGKPELKRWRGFKKKKERYPIATFRCEVCGYLESYASVQE